MDARLALGVLLGGPALYAVLAWLGTVTPPLVAAGLGLMVYWGGLGAALALRADPHRLRALLPAEPPGRLIAVMLALPVLAWGAVTLRLLGDAPLPPHLLVAAALAALLHATLEELFWRGALIPRPGPRAAALALGLYWAFHLAWTGMRDVETGLSPTLAVFGPLALGGVWTASRLSSGTLGAAIMAHAGLALFLFAGTIARSLAPS
ncbi:CPBP family glutamic-type intramembrane protease [Rubellimicrobium arenae]|uniref:CPBP family glutamic-type intramembrane protease n=1 Tax=Rubellimicrobium arenae TaxID=2817372 RepID=UPI001B316562|nr:CPBP family glutamic-type intramembrane protease [Rubellimicrobium arenae]